MKTGFFKKVFLLAAGVFLLLTPGPSVAVDETLSRQQPVLSLDSKGEELSQALKYFQELTDYRIVINEEPLQRPVWVRFRDQDLSRALKLTLKAAGVENFALVFDDQARRVMVVIPILGRAGEEESGPREAVGRSPEALAEEYLLDRRMDSAPAPSGESDQARGGPGRLEEILALWALEDQADRLPPERPGGAEGRVDPARVRSLVRAASARDDLHPAPPGDLNEVNRENPAEHIARLVEEYERNRETRVLPPETSGGAGLVPEVVHWPSFDQGESSPPGN